MQQVHLVRVRTDSDELQVWLAATVRDEAVDAVLEVVPEGWTASLVDHPLDPDEAAALGMRAGEVRQHQFAKNRLRFN